VISGTPTSVVPTATYIVTATNSFGFASASVSITVNDSIITYSNSSLITIRDNNTATPYPSTITVPTTAGTIAKVTVQLNGFNHTYPADAAILLVGPLGQKFLLFYHIGGGTDAVGANLTFTDSVTTSLPSAIVSGTYKPSTYSSGTYTFPSPAPAYPYLSGALSSLNGTNPSGTWSIYVRDDANTDSGTLSGGWSLSFAITPPAVVAPSSLSYSSNPATYTKATAITNNTPASGGGAVASYAVSPALPAGLTLNTSTGVISGTPTAVTSTTTYTVTATNTGGSTTAPVSITIRDIAPSALTYSSNPATYTTGTAITSNTPASGGGAVVSYAVSPALPAGLTLNTSTGVISGTPTAVTSTATYTVTATNSGGFTTASLSIAVVTLYSAWATQYNLVQGPTGDDDGDGNSNNFEFVAGLIPTNASSVFQTAVSAVPGQPNQLAISFSPIVAGRTYTVKSTGALSPATWLPLSSFTSSDNGAVRTVIDNSAAIPPVFYRVEFSLP
jgi:subtilisin-like proprotein convertase family protein